MPEWLLKWGVSWGFSWAVSYLAARIRKDRAVLAGLLQYRAGGTFMQIARSYAAVTPELSDNQIVESIMQLQRDLMVVPFNQLVTQNYFLALLAGTKVPDFDGDPSNDQAVTDLLAKIVEESLAAKGD